MRVRFPGKSFGTLLLVVALVSCSSLEQKKGKEISLPSPQPENPSAGPMVNAPPPPLPPPLLSLKKPSGAMDLESPVSLTVTEGSLKEVLQAITEQAEVNLILDRDVVDENVTINIKNLPLWQALDGLLTAHNLYFSSQSGYIRISRMMSRTFHLDYIRSLRTGMSNTQVTLSSGANTGETSPTTTANQSTTTLGALGGGNSAGDISIQSLEVVDFWKDFEKNLRQIMRDPLYEILRSEYDQKDLRRDLRMLPYEEEYEREAMKQQLENFRLQRELMQKRLETGVAGPEAAGTPEAIAPPEASSTGRSQTGGEQTQEKGTTEQEGRLVGTYSLDPQTGTLVVTSTPEVMSRMESFLAQLKQNLNRQVFIDVQILEVALTDETRLGVDWGAFPGLVQYYRMPQLTSIINSQMAQQAQGGGGGTGTTGGQGLVSPLATSPFATSPQGSLQLGVLSTIGSNQAVQYALNSVISFLQQYGDVKALSRPQITTLNNQPAVVSVGVNDFYITFQQQTTSAQAGLATASVTSQLNPLFIGVTLNVTPQISPEGDIAMKIVPAINKKVGEKTVPTGIPSSPNQTIPLLETRQTSTLVRIKDGETIIISGLIQEHEDKVEKDVPYLSSIPGAGWLFRHNTTIKGNSELVLLLTPHCAERSLNINNLGYREVTKDR